MNRTTSRNLFLGDGGDFHLLVAFEVPEIDIRLGIFQGEVLDSSGDNGGGALKRKREEL